MRLVRRQLQRVEDGSPAARQPYGLGAGIRGVEKGLNGFSFVRVGTRTVHDTQLNRVQERDDDGKSLEHARLSRLPRN